MLALPPTLTALTGPNSGAVCPSVYAVPTSPELGGGRGVSCASDLPGCGKCPHNVPFLGSTRQDFHGGGETRVPRLGPGLRPPAHATRLSPLDALYGDHRAPRSATDRVPMAGLPCSARPRDAQARTERPMNLSMPIA